jgi:beta-lactamase regulating signal transducer with metallopeptidase domain/uncharacterized GH25 family protein
MLNDMITYANSAGDRWAAWMVAATLDAALLLALISVVWLAIRKRVAPHVGYGLFLLVPLKLLVPVVVPVPTAFFQWTPSALISSWLYGADARQTIASRAPVELAIAEVTTDKSATSKPAFKSLSQPRTVASESQPPTLPTERRPARRNPPTSANALTHSMRVAPRLSVSAMCMTAWLVSILLLFGRLAGTQLRFRASLRSLSPLDESKLPIDLPDLCRRAGAPVSIRIVESAGIAAPAVWGIARPTIILPRGIASALSARQLRWVLLHELAHIWRHDLIVVMLQRFAAILHFFNPAIWIANRVIHQLREYACDDLAVTLSDASAVESGEAFVRILQNADRGRRGLEGALGVFGLDSRASCFHRVRRLLDSERPIRTAPGAWSVCGLILLAIVSAPHLRAENEASVAASQDPVKESTAPSQRKAKANADNAVARDGKEFELLVVGPDGKPIPEASVELATSPALTGEQIVKGKFVIPRSHRAVLTTDAQGQIVVKLPQAPTRFNVFITIPGYGPYWAGWSSDSHDEPIPSRFTAELEAAWSVGGVLVDVEGKPIAGVKIRSSIEFKKRPGVTQQFGSGETRTTDVAGKWRFDSVPVSMKEVYVEINHTGYRPVQRALARTVFGLERGQEPVTKVVLDRGLTVIGKVTDEAGKPIDGALVRTKFVNDIREATTGRDGTYRLVGCEARPTRIVVSAKGRATDMKELNIEPAMAPVDFQMKPGGTVRIRALDDNGNPAPKARIFFQRWRGPFHYFEFNHVSQYADENGIWVWNEAPLDEFLADICPADGMQLLVQPLLAREEEYVFRLPAALVISGKVIDAETKEPIKKLRVVPGVRSSEEYMYWIRPESFPASDGNYRLRRTRGDFAHLVRIEADGYQAAVSRDIKSTEGMVTIDFELKKGQNIVAKVVTPRNLPAVGAKVALGVAGAQIHLKNGEINDLGSSAARESTDEKGRFHFPAQDADFQLVITHPSGYAYIKSPPEWDLARIIRLEPWSKVEGTFRIGTKPAANVPLTIDAAGLESPANDALRVSTQYESTTGPDGRFVFDRVIAGYGRIGRSITMMANEGATEVTSSCMIATNFPAGETVHMDLGGTGRPIVGTLKAADGFTEKVRWNFAMVWVMAAAPEFRVTAPQLRATVNRDGTFRIDDVPAGDYSLNVRFQQNGSGQLLNHRFQVSPPEGDLAVQPVELGTLTLENP